MKKLFFFGLAFFLAASLIFAAPGKKTFVGYISDSVCGLKHEMAPGMPDKQCTVTCVRGPQGYYVLADRANKKVYKLSDQSTPEKFAGEKVKVTGTLDGDTIKVASIEAAH